MTNAVYPKAKEAMLNAMLTLGTPKAVLIDTGIVPFSPAHQYFAAVQAAVVGSPVTLTGVTTTDGVFDAGNDPQFTGLVSAPSVEAVALYVDTGNPATSPLLAFIDTATGLPVTSGATQVNVAWDNGTNRIFRI